jgi:hypothetical protein
MLFVVTAVAVHGNLVPTGVAVQVPMEEGPTAVQSPPNVAAVISISRVDETVTVNDDLVQIEVMLPRPGSVFVYPRLGESSVWCEPTTPQLDAEAIDGIMNAHNAIAAAKSKMPFLENFVMSMLLVSPANAETNGCPVGAGLRERCASGPFKHAPASNTPRHN